MNNPTTYSSGLKSRKSSIFSPNPTNFTGKCNSFLIASTIPPLAVPSNLVRTIPVTLVTSLNCFACVKAFCPVVASKAHKTSCGASGISLVMTLAIFSNYFIKLTLFCKRPAVSTNKMS